MRPEPKQWKLLGTILWGFGIAIVSIVLQAVMLVYYVLKGRPHLTAKQVRDALAPLQHDGAILSISTMVTALIFCTLVAVAIKLKRGSNLTDYLSIKTVPGKTLLRWLAFLAIFIVLSDLLTIFLGRPVVPEVMTTAYATAHPIWIIWVAFVFAAPLSEEIFFRGFLFKGFASSFGSIGAVVLTAVLWAASHIQYDAYGIGTILVFGLLLGSARMLTGSLIVPMAMHAISNLVSTTESAVINWH